MTNWRQVLIFVTIIALLARNSSANNSRPPRNNDISNMADALKYLQDLDTYYGDRARVRFGKRASLIQLLKNHLTNEAEMVSKTIKSLKDYISDLDIQQQNHPIDLAAAEEPF